MNEKLMVNGRYSISTSDVLKEIEELLDLMEEVEKEVQKNEL